MEYTVVASCCQCYFWCKEFPCDKCQRVEFNIKEKDTDNLVGMLIKAGRGCCKNAFLDDYNNFTVEFPKGSTWAQRALLITCAVFIDFMMFEEKGKKDAGASMG